MFENLTNRISKDQSKVVIPKSVQDIIPVNTIYDDGIFKLNNGMYSKMYKFSDINYEGTSDEDKYKMLSSYADIINTFDTNAITKITINNRSRNRDDIENTITIKERGKGLDKYVDEYVKEIYDKSKNGKHLTQDKYITVSISKKNIEDARTYFSRTYVNLTTSFNRLDSKISEVSLKERLKMLHDFYADRNEEFIFDLNKCKRRCQSFKDTICPDSIEIKRDYFKLGNEYGRVLFIKSYASYIEDNLISKIMDLNTNLILTIDIEPISTEKAIKETESRLLGIETNITNWQRKQNANNNFSANVPLEMENQRNAIREFLNDLVSRDQRMLDCTLVITHKADSKKQLDYDTESLYSIAQGSMCQLGTLNFQQIDGLNTSLPYGLNNVEVSRTFITESLAAIIPFRVQDIFHKNGIYYGKNAISNNHIIVDRKQLLNGNSFILGVSGSGKSFAAKYEIRNLFLGTNADIIIIDPEREYNKLTKALNGEVINISSTSDTHINPMDINSEYGDGPNPVILKSEFITSLCEQLIDESSFGSKQKSIIDRCCANVYREYQLNGYKGDAPTLQDFRNELLKQEEREAKDIALEIERFTSGSLNTFAKKTNVDTNNRLICYDILDLGKQLLPMGMLVVLDSIFNRVTRNRAKGKSTFIFIDEIYLLFEYEYSANFLFTLWKRVRKYGAFATGITQNVDDLLQSHTARTMLANSEFIIMLNQASTDRVELANLLNISELQMSYITNVEAGHGLIKVGSSLVPFSNKFPKNTKLYKLMTTKPGEGE